MATLEQDNHTISQSLETAASDYQTAYALQQQLDANNAQYELLLTQWEEASLLLETLGE